MIKFKVEYKNFLTGRIKVREVLANDMEDARTKMRPSIFSFYYINFVSLAPPVSRQFFQYDNLSAPSALIAAPAAGSLELPTNPAVRNFINLLPRILGHGENNATRAVDILDRIGFNRNETSKRQLRVAKAYLIATGVPICTSKSDGYYIAESREEILTAAAIQREHAANFGRAAAELEALANTAFPEFIFCGTGEANNV